MKSNHYHPPRTEEVLETVKAVQANGDLFRKLTQDGPAYQISLTHPRYLEAVYGDGTVSLGRFVCGEFVAIKDLE